ncbi:MAG: DUF3524 domain-containing protein, partial [Spirochaetaceae bacterium]|nr:DUF3524 domain-containing protein [Spirochaetaceae bacterium]
FYGGSHKSFADGLIQHSTHTFDLLTLPDKYWKWRMRGAALYFAEKLKDFSIYDGIIASNMLSLSDFKAICGGNLPPIVLYFHENQILYPLATGEQEDLHYGFTDITSSLCADYIIFNSSYHKDAYLNAIKPFLSRFPDKRPFWVTEKIQHKSNVIYPGCSLNQDFIRKAKIQNPPLIIWNHRWEHDKNPEDFFDALFHVADDGVDFKLALLGEQFKNSPKIFNIAKRKLRNKIVHFGYISNFKEYKQWLAKGDIVLSTSIQENFGISIVEAIGSGSFPLLPDRLSYRELIPEKMHNLCIYKNQNDLIKKLKKLITYYDTNLANELTKQNLRFSWENMIKQYDQFLNSVKKKSLQ